MVRFSMLDRELKPRVMRMGVVAALALATLAWPVAGRGGEPWLVQDINTNEPTRSDSYIYDHPVYVNGMIYHAVSSGGYTSEVLHLSDGVSSRTISLERPMEYDYYIQNMIAWRGQVLFALISDNTNTGLIWKSDGTTSGTVPIETSDGYHIQDSLMASGDWAYFYGWKGKEGLIRTDGTVEGTRLLNERLVLKKDTKEVDPNPARLMADVNGALFFITKLDGNLKGLWRTDGTDSGTLLKSFARTYSGDVEQGEIINVGGMVFIAINEGPNIRSLWKSDGSPEGTVLVKQVAASHLTAVGGNTLFFVGNDPEHGSELWKSDGTPEGTVMVKDIRPGTDTGFSLWFSHERMDDRPHFTDVNGVLYFVADDGVHGQELWKSDGTAEGTVMVRDVSSESYYDSYHPYFALFEANGTLCYFSSEKDAEGALGLWACDGTSEGTKRIANVAPAIRYVYRDNKYAEYLDMDACEGPGEYEYFRGYDYDNGYEMWRTDGTAEGTRQVTDTRHPDSPSFPSPVARVADTYLFTAYEAVERWDSIHTNLWRIDGPNSCTKILSNFRLDPIDRPIKTAFNLRKGVLMAVGEGAPSYTANTGIITDGTAAGTMEISKGQFGLDSMTILDGICYYISGGFDGKGLWKTDGSPEGTVKVHHSFGGRINNYNGTLYYGGSDIANNVYFWKSDGTTSGTVPIKKFQGNLPEFRTGYNGQVFFIADDGDHDRALWVTDGTETGTQLQIKVEPDNNQYYFGTTEVLNNGVILFSGKKIWRCQGGSAPVEKVAEFPNAYYLRSGTVMNGSTLFLYTQSASGVQTLWRTDGTSEGTHVLFDETSGSTWFRFYTGPHGTQLFTRNATEWTTPPRNYIELYATDGTLAGTRKLASADLVYPPASISSWLMNDLFYFVTEDIVNGVELWRSDGTPEGTFMLKDINPGPESSFPTEFVEMNGLVYFNTSGGLVKDRKLWCTDGTREGTRLAIDDDPGLTPDNPTQLTLIKGRLYFTASDPDHGVEIWRTDGTLAGTERLTDIAPGPSSSNPSGFMQLGNTLYFSATDQTVIGTELYAIDLGNAAGGAWRMYR